MVGNFLYRLCVIIIHLIYGLCLFVCGFCCENTVAESDSTELLTVLCVVGNVLSNNITRTGKGFLYIVYAFFFVNVFRSLNLKRGLISFTLLHYELCKPLKTFLTRNRSTCFTFRTVGTVYIVDLGKSLGVIDGGNKLVGQLTLCLNESLDLFSTLFNVAKVGKSVL